MSIVEWSDFFVATAGAAAGLVGLIIIAMSVNIETIAVGAALLGANVGAGLYAVAAGILAVFITSVLSAWVLLVEIRR